MAAINNNPFEYWITYNDAYDKLMVNIEEFIEHPASDPEVSQVFTNEMFDKLDKRLTETAGWKSMREYWSEDFSKRKIVSSFLKDPLLGKKRLASMPDRVTNTIHTATGEMVFRPTVINQYTEDLSSMDIWYAAWEKFMFDDPLKIEKDDATKELIPYQMLKSISKAKYPSIEEQEEADSLPLQTLCGAIFDAILVYMMNDVSKPAEWQTLKRTMVEKLNKQKTPNTLSILKTQYAEADIITLQEVSTSFVAKAKEQLTNFQWYLPENVDATRDQNSVIGLSRTTFPSGMGSEVTEEVVALLDDKGKKGVATGDVLALTAKSAAGDEYVIASFHGDTNGLMTKPVLDAVAGYFKTTSGKQLIFGLDANTYENGVEGEKQDVLDFAKRYKTYGFSSCWGDTPNPSNYTTYNARTYLQPQLNKACKKEDRRAKGDVNPKDFIIFPKSAFHVVRTWKDNTGKGTYTEDMTFPTLDFPSDHGLLSTILEPVESGESS